MLKYGDSIECHTMMQSLKKMKHMNLNQFNKKSTVTSIEFFRRELFS